ELKARVRALLRRRQPAAEGGQAAAADRASLLVAGSLTLDRRTRQVHLGANVVQLTPAEFDILYHLMTHPGEIFSSQQLLRQVWGYTPETADPGLVRWHIKNLRAKIEPDPIHPIYIRTVPHQGYILISDF
ncbi:MAG: winged helix-turn-helix domain-containing protein, partial [Chloroflexota bacterium]|nr:winged helix-turn-helix domain-containing protein [Chloroflexota bacterium]